jgi:phage baseplate assembly protein W
MPENNERWGYDLRLLGNLNNQNDRQRGSDLYTRRVPGTGAIDLETLAGQNNLRQALLLRFLIPQGEMEILGHPDYGSRLYELLGELNVERTHHRAKMYVLQALAMEPRIEKVLSVKVTQNRAVREQMDIDIWFIPLHSDTPLNLVFPFFLEGGV